ncbi:MAG: protein-glutamate O-methyltransferase [Paracoccaceae bacterium]
MVAAPRPTDPGLSGPATTDVPLSPRDFSRIAAYALREFGLNLQESKKDLVYARLIRRVRQLGLADFTGYCQLLEGPDTLAERDFAISALTTNVTYFFRESHHFDLLSALIAPRRAALQKGQRLRLWSAGCAAGMEAYSMALTLHDALPEAPDLNIRILATDIDPNSLARGKSGVFIDEEVQPIPQRMRAKGLLQQANGTWRIAPCLASMTRFAPLNLVQDWPLKGPFDAIFCRNVAIYFDKPTQTRLWHRFAPLLAPNGLLCIGHAERLLGPAEREFTPIGITAYQKTTAVVPQ